MPVAVLVQNKRGVHTEQKRVAEKIRDMLEKQGLRIATEIFPAGPFYRAEEYHQNYYERKGVRPACHRRIVRFPDD